MTDKKKKYPLRSIIRAREGCSLISTDLSAAEAWVVAYLARDVNMQRELAGGDLHKYAASIIFQKPTTQITKEERYVGKKGNHSLNYRTSAGKLCESINKEGIVTVSLPQAKTYYERWHSAFNVRMWWADIDDKLRRDRTLITPYQRKRIFYGMWNDDLLKEATAYVPQSTVADHMNGAVQPELGIKGGLLEIYHKVIKKSKNEIKMIQTAHDSVVLECPRPLLNEISEQVVSLLRRPLVVNGETFTIPVDCDIYPERWGEQ
jgi:DNA polymerase I-like protein with 3'-5' exonuclease and polymerase domains